MNSSDSKRIEHAGGGNSHWEGRNAAYPPRMVTGATLGRPPAITIGTMHSVKGGEAERVYLWPDLSQLGYQEWMTIDGREAIRRLFYVGLTRAREEVVFLAPSSGCSLVWGT